MARDAANAAGSAAPLARAAYTSPEVFARDVERIFLRQWIYAGHASSIPRPGDYFLYDLAEESFVVLRDEAGDVRAHLNVCPHRGSRVCIEEYGRAKALVCPYHGWTFGLDGGLQSMGHAPLAEKRAARDLQTLGVQVLDGLIFLCAGNPPPEWKGIASDAAAMLGPAALEQTRIAYHRRYLCPANWKLVIESFLALFDHGPLFEEFAQVFLFGEAMLANAAVRKAYAAVAETWLAAQSSELKGTRSVELTEQRAVSTGRLPIRPGFVTATRDGKPAAPLLGGRNHYTGGVAWAHILNSWFIAADDHAVAIRFTPIDPKVTEMDVTWLVGESAVEGDDYRAENLSWLWRAVIERTLKVCSDQQNGVQSARYVPGPLATNEGRIATFRRWHAAQTEAS